MSSSEKDTKALVPAGYSSISSWHPPDKFPGFYKSCASCQLIFYTRFNFIHCPTCRNAAERELSTRYKLKRRP